jgi:hypothetical protein
MFRFPAIRRLSEKDSSLPIDPNVYAAMMAASSTPTE